MHVLTLRPAGLRKGTPPSYVSVWVNLLTSLPARKETKGVPLAVYGANLTAAFSISLLQTYLHATHSSNYLRVRDIYILNLSFMRSPKCLYVTLAA